MTLHSSDCIASNIGKIVGYKREGCESELLGHDLEHYCTFAGIDSGKSQKKKQSR